MQSGGAVERHPLSARVVVAEDDPELRELLVQALEKDGYEVQEIENGDQLITYLGTCEGIGEGERTPNIIVSDVRMPGYDGLEILEGLREAGWNTPVILITAFGDPALHRRALGLGAVAVFDKPFDLDDLRTAVLCTLEAERQQEALA